MAAPSPFFQTGPRPYGHMVDASAAVQRADRAPAPSSLWSPPPPTTPPTAIRREGAPARSEGFTRPQRDLLRALVHMHLVHGQAPHALALLRLVAQDSREDRQFLRAYAHALTLSGMGKDALEVLDDLDRLDAPSMTTTSLLLRSRALHQTGRLDEARLIFQRFLELRRAGEGRARPRASRGLAPPPRSPLSAALEDLQS